MPASLVWVPLLVVGLWLVAIVLDRRDRAARLNALRESWAMLRVRDRDMPAIDAYYRAVTGDRSSESLDDRTWNDLNMSDVFSVLDRTESAIGQQALYARLRTLDHNKYQSAFEALVTRMTEDGPVRERAQLALGRLRGASGYDLWRLAQPNALQAEAWHVLFPIAGVSMAGLLVILPFWSPAVLLLALGALGSLIARVSVAPHLRIVTGAFRLVNPLVSTAGLLSLLSNDATSPLLGALREDVGKLSRVKRIASWAGRDPSAAVAGNIAAVVFEYLNMVLWLDANALFFGARELNARAPELLRVIAAVGDVDAAISVASYRAGTEGWSRPTLRAAGRVVMRDVRHPLLPDAVPNSIALAPPNGIVITGSNMSGKSTFLRTVGVAAVMAQTVNTCLATTYDAPVFVVRSCIGLADDPATGKSYYLVEVESVLALVHAARTSVPHLMLFDELFRGTNAVERIAGAEAVLRSLLTATGRASAPHVVIAATHDQELVDLLDGMYESFHFADTIDETGLAFDYTLHRGPATTRNAIALLGLRGAPPELVAQALARARSLDRARTAAT